MELSQRAPQSTRRADQWAAAIVLSALFLAGALPLILTDRERGRAADDQIMWHLPAIRQFARQIPRPDFHDYPSATTPLYHLLVATADRWVTSDIRALRLVGALFTVGLLATLGAALARRAPAWMAIALCLPMVTSLYVLGSGAWLLPDNAGWWGVLAVMLVCFRRRVDRWTYIVGGVLLVLLVLVRQSHAWVAAPLWLAAWIGSENGGPPPAPAASPVRRLALMVLATVPALAVLLYFFHLWHGPVPPSIQFFHDPTRAVGKSWNPAVPATVLGVAGVLGVFFLDFIPRQKSPRAIAFALEGAAVGLVLGVLPVSTYSHQAGRESGIWNLVPHAPVIGDRSLVIAVLAMLGGAVLGWWCAALNRRDRWMFATAWASFIAAQTVNTTAWQRYYEPFVLIMLALTALRIERGRWSFAAAIGPLLLAGLLGVVTVASLR